MKNFAYRGWSIIFLRILFIFAARTSYYVFLYNIRMPVFSNLLGGRRRGINNDGLHKLPLALFSDRTPAIPIRVLARQDSNWRFPRPNKEVANTSRSTSREVAHTISTPKGAVPAFSFIWG